MNPFTRQEVLDVGEDLDQLELTAQFLEDLATRIVGDEERQLCRIEAQRFRLAAGRHHKQTGRLTCENTTATRKRAESTVEQ